MSLGELFALDAAAITVLVFAVYFPRHRRREMVVAYLGINFGVLGVTQALASAEISAGLGLGLFGVLSIIRLRSNEMDQSEVAYYFAALALGLLGGFPVTPGYLSPALMVALVLAVYVGDHPALFSRYRQQTVVLDHAFTEEGEARLHVAALLGAEVHRLTIRKIDLVNDTTLLDVRFRLPAAAEPAAQSAPFQDAAER